MTFWERLGTTVHDNLWGVLAAAGAGLWWLVGRLFLFQAQIDALKLELKSQRDELKAQRDEMKADLSDIKDTNKLLLQRLLNQRGD